MKTRTGTIFKRGSLIWVSGAVCVGVLCLCGNLFAETIVLKSGKKIEGKILEKTDRSIKIDFYGVPVTYYVNEIEHIDGQPVVAEDPVSADTYPLEANRPRLQQTTFKLKILDETLLKTEGGMTQEDAENVTIAFENGQTRTFVKKDIGWPSHEDVEAITESAQVIASQALAYFLDRDHHRLYELNHSYIKTAMAEDQMKEYIARAYPELGKPLNFDPFLTNKLYSYGYYCLTFEVQLRFEKSKAAAVISVTKDEKANGALRVLHFSFFPNVSKFLQ